MEWNSITFPAMRLKIKNLSFIQTQEMNEITKLAINLLSYIYCFPDCLVDGAPHDVKTENNHYLNTSEKVVDVTEKAAAGVVIPHFRRGYFKRLSSDFYKNKKG